MFPFFGSIRKILVLVYFFLGINIFVKVELLCKIDIK